MVVKMTKLRKLNPNKLYPPKDVLIKISQKKKENLLRNPFVKFFHTFFGEGF